MKLARLRALWARLEGSLWFLPSLIVLGAAGLAITLVWVDAGSSFHLGKRFPLVFGAGPDGSRGVLSAIASSVITVAGVVFSITIVSLSLASTQYSPRVLRNFMSDRPTQVVLGSFVAIFTYCILVLRTIRSGDGESTFVPSIAVLAGIVLALISVAFLVYFIHHVAASIQASSILARIARETLVVIDRVYPKNWTAAPDDGGMTASEGAKSWTFVEAARTGYVNFIDYDRLRECAKAQRMRLRVHHAIGDFVIEGRPLISVDRAPSAGEMRKLTRCIDIDDQRTLGQDPCFGIQQMVDVALKGLSPGINDTSTALLCLDQLTAVLSRLAGRRLRRAGTEDLGERVTAAGDADFGAMLAMSFDSIRRNATGNVDVLSRLIDCGTRIAEVTPDPARRLLLAHHVEATLGAARASVTQETEREALQAKARRALLTIQAGTPLTASAPNR